MKGRNGFTLIELLLAMSMFALLTAAGFAALSAGTHAASKAKRYNAMISRGHAALESMSRDIRAAVEHDEYRLVALDNEYQGLAVDTIDFICAKDARLESEDLGITGRCEVGYYIENREDEELGWLLRREDSSIDEDPLEGGVVSLAGPYVVQLNLQFYDGLYWQSGWDMDEENQPLAVYIQLEVMDEDGVENSIILSKTVPIMVR